MHIHLEQEVLEQFIAGYQKDESFKRKWNELESPTTEWNPGNQFYKDDAGLLFFRDADYQPRLCVPKSEQPAALKEAHDQPFGGAHIGPERLWQTLSSRFYWPQMKANVLRFCHSCDICQKTKPSNFKRFGLLIPNPIPSRPYDSISMDFIVNLPWSEDYNAILVIVDRLTKHAQFIPTTTGLDAEGFALLFVKHIATRFGLPTSIVSDRDPRWLSDFWKGVTKCLKTRLAMSSSHHPQHDGQTEVTNKTLETMARAYAQGAKDSWAEWLHLLEFTYNATTHSSTSESPYFLLYGYCPRSPLDFLANLSGPNENEPRYAHNDNANKFLQTMDMHRQAVRTAIAKAQTKQADSYNRGRRVVDFPIGSLVLLNPHSLEWKESKEEGAKLVQRWIGPFEVTEKVNPKVYRLRLDDRYPGSPVVNVEHLKKYAPSPEEFGIRTELLDTCTSKPESEEYEVDSIVGHRINKKSRKFEFLIRWRGYNPHHDSWASERDMHNAPEILRKYRKKAAI